MNEPERIPLRRRSSKYRPLDERDWEEVEQIIGVHINNRTRQLISMATDLFAAFGRTHAKDNTILRSEVLPEVKLWLKATNRLAHILKLPPVATDQELRRKDAIDPFLGSRRERNEKLERILDLHFLRLSVRSARAAGQYVHNRLKNRNGSSLASDLWATWVCLVAHHLSQADAKISASSTNKSSRVSPFVLVIKKLQSHLPPGCRRHSRSDEALTKHIQSARRILGKLSEKQLALILAGWGSNIVSSFPGPLSKLAPEEIDELTAGVFQSLEVRVRKSLPDNKK
jgi:hypothetical protein